MQKLKKFSNGLPPIKVTSQMFSIFIHLHVFWHFQNPNIHQTCPKSYHKKRHNPIRISLICILFSIAISWQKKLIAAYNVYVEQTCPENSLFVFLGLQNVEKLHFSTLQNVSPFQYFYLAQWSMRKSKTSYCGKNVVNWQSAHHKERNHTKQLFLCLKLNFGQFHEENTRNRTKRNISICSYIIRQQT